MTFRIALLLLFFSVCIIPFGASRALLAQTISVGQGSYSTQLPAGAVGPSNFNNQAISPKVSPDFTQPIQTNDFWSSLIFPFSGTSYSNVMYAHPVNAKAISSGLQIGYTPDYVLIGSDYVYPFRHQLTVGVEGLNAASTLAESYGDWTVSASWADNTKKLTATFGHGLPFVYFKLEGGDALIQSTGSPTVWFDDNGVLGITIQGIHYGIFAPEGSSWDSSNGLRSDLNDEGFLSVAVLPDNEPQTLALFNKHAYAFVVNSQVTWNYNQERSMVEATYAYETELQQEGEDYTNAPLTALYRHQWLNSTDPLTNYAYASPRGEMKLLAGSQFRTTIPFYGVMPALADLGDYNRQELLEFVQEAATQSIPAQDTYNNGKALARFTNLVHIADQLGALEERDYFLNQIKERLEDWLTAGGAQEYSYNQEWSVLTGYPSSFGADSQINDHHFHSAYAIISAATVARFDTLWASQDQYGGMINLLIKDANNWDRSDAQFPFLRSFDAYAGHSWASGHADFADGNNQESSSESMNFNAAAILWGEATGQPDIRDAGIYLYTTEAAAIHQYWFDSDEQTFPPNYPHVALGMVWGSKGVHSTWFGNQPEFIHGINFLPVTASALYLGLNPDYVLRNYAEIVDEVNGQPTLWKDVLWKYLALSDAEQALNFYNQDPNYAPFDGASKAHTLHWLHNLKKMGRPLFEITANIPTYAVFETTKGDRSYLVYNSGSTARMVDFSDGRSFEVQPKQLFAFSTAETATEGPVAEISSNKSRGKAPLNVELDARRSFDRQGEPINYLWTFPDSSQSSTSDTTLTFSQSGEYLIRLEVTNQSGLRATDTLTIEVLANGTPFSGEAPIVPARIEAEEYDLGGQDVAYNDVDANNIGLAYRPDEGVDIESSSSGGYDVYWIVAGEWLEYTFEVYEEGYYDFIPYVATVPGFGNFRLYVDNIDISGRIEVPHTGGWQNWEAKPIERVFLEAGVHIMRFEFDSDSDKTGWLFSLDYTDITRSVDTSLDDEAQRPNQVRLDQNYPNPFNPSTQISYSLSETALIALEVFNVQGQKVAELVNQVQSAGNYSISFNAKNLSSGIYIYRLSTPKGQIIRKMSLVK